MKSDSSHSIIDRHRRSHGEAGQAIIEFVFVVFMMLAMLFALIDFGRAIYERQIIVDLTREGSNLASRATTISNAVVSVISSASPLNLSTKGRVIMTAVTNSNGVNYITQQIAQGGISATSKVGTGVGNKATIPVTNPVIPQLNQTMYVTEVFYSFAPITPIGKLLGLTLPAQLYDVAYF